MVEQRAQRAQTARGLRQEPSVQGLRQQEPKEQGLPPQGLRQQVILKQPPQRPALPPQAAKPAAAPAEASLNVKARQRSKTLSVLEGSLVSASSGFTGNFISAFAIALGSSNTIIALLSTLPYLIASITQLGVQFVRSFFKTRKGHIVFFATLQALMWLPLIFAPQLQHAGGWLLLFVTLNVVFGMLIGPVWNSFISDIVEEDERGRFFGMRNMFTGMTAFISTLLAGWLLSVTAPSNPLLGFSILFGLACAFRLMSAYFLNKMDDPPEAGISDKQPDVVGFALNVHKTDLGRFTLFLMFFNIAVHIASPFFAVYELSILKFDYWTFTLLASASAVSSFVTMLFWGKHVDRIGSKNVLVACGFLIPLVPFFWTLTIDPWKLALVEIFSGIVWAGFNLSVSTYLFDATNRERRTQELAVYTLFIHLAIFFGAMLGSGLLGFFDKTNKNAFIFIFMLSAVLRLTAMLIFYRMLRELRIIEVPIRGRLFRKFITIRPQHGVVYETAVESPADTQLRKLRAREIKEELEDFARKARDKPKRPPGGPPTIKDLERQEDDADTQAYLKKLRK